MSLASKLLSASGGVDKLYVDDVFSAYTYTGNGSTQTINNGIDLAAKGGMVWGKVRSFPYDHQLHDTARGAANFLSSNLTSAQVNQSSVLTSFNSNGFSVGASARLNDTGQTYVSWAFRKAPKFFDVVTYTGNGVAGRQIPHALGIAPGMVVTKRLDLASGFAVLHKDANLLFLNGTDAAYSAAITATRFGDGTNVVRPTDTVFTVGTTGECNISGATYVAYLFAHDPSADGIIQCGSYTGNGSATGPVINLGWEPQYVMLKNAGSTGNWLILDTARGFTVSADNDLYANLSNADGTGLDFAEPIATGFNIKKTGVDINSSGISYIYLAIRRPNKPPSLGTQVYNAIARTGTGAAATVTGVGFAPDLAMIARRAVGGSHSVIDRLRGRDLALGTAVTDAEAAQSVGVDSFNMDGVTLGTASPVNASAATLINHFFKRAPGVFDQVCYTGTGSYPLVVPHSLSVAPELIIIKKRSGADSWWTLAKPIVSPSATWYQNYVSLNTANTSAGPESSITVPPSSSALTFAAYYGDASATYVAYLFATKNGISKVGSYTGNGTSLTIDCGFTTGSRFVMIKRTDAAGDWYVWDSVRGIVAGNDPHLSLNTTAAEVTTDDSIDPSSVGFIVNQVAATNINVNAASYIFLSFA